MENSSTPLQPFVNFISAQEEVLKDLLVEDSKMQYFFQLKNGSS